MRRRLYLFTLIIMSSFICYFPVIASSNSSDPYYYSSISLFTNQGEPIILPDEVLAYDKANNKISNVRVDWVQSTVSNINYNQPGEYEVKFIPSGSSEEKIGSVTVLQRGKQVRVSAVGDSITSGWNLDGSTIWTQDKNYINKYKYPSQLDRLLGPQYIVNEFGNHGKTALNRSSDSYAKTPEYQASIKSNPNIVVLQLGTNDTKTGILGISDNWQYNKYFYEDYLELINTYAGLSTHPKIYIAIPPPILPEAENDGLYGRMNQKNLEILIPKMFEAAENASVPVTVIDQQTDPNMIEFLSKNSKYTPGDGVHPSREGAAVLASNVYKSIIGEKQGKTVEDISLMDYETISGGTVEEYEGRVVIDQLTDNSWIHYKNVNIRDGEIEFLAGYTGNNDMEVVATIDQYDGPEVGRTILAKTNGTDDKLNKISLGNTRGVHDIYLHFKNESSIMAKARLSEISFIDGGITNIGSKKSTFNIVPEEGYESTYGPYMKNLAIVHKPKEFLFESIAVSDALVLKNKSRQRDAQYVTVNDDRRDENDNLNTSHWKLLAELSPLTDEKGQPLEALLVMKPTELIMYDIGTNEITNPDGSIDWDPEPIPINPLPAADASHEKTNEVRLQAGSKISSEVMRAVGPHNNTPGVSTNLGEASLHIEKNKGKRIGNYNGKITWYLDLTP